MTGCGLFPVLSLANHHCDPNASIEFLGESREGSLVALRDIPSGEEICVTYVPNGDWDCGENEEGGRFRNFRPTRTWTYLNRGYDESDAQEEEDQDEGHKIMEIEETGTSKVDAYAYESAGFTMAEHGATVPSSSDDTEDHHDCNEKDSSIQEIMNEGSNWSDRSRALSEYGFICRCARCEHEQSAQDGPYCRQARSSVRSAGH